MLFTILPEKLVQLILEKLGDAQSFFSYIVTQENLIENEHSIVKDLSCLCGNRSLEDLIVIETQPGRVEENVSSLVLPQCAPTEAFQQIVQVVKGVLME